MASAWDDDEDDKPKLVIGATYYVVSMAVMTSFKARAPPERMVDLSQDPLRASPTVLRPGMLGRDFDVVAVSEFDPYLSRHRAVLTNTPLVRTCIKLADGKPSIDLFPVTVQLALAGGGAGAAGATFATPRSTPVKELLVRAREVLGGARAPPLCSLRLWKVLGGGAAAGAAGGGGGGGGAPPPQQLALLAGKTLESHLTEEEMNLCAVRVVVEQRGEDGLWPQGCTTRAVRVRGAWAGHSPAAFAAAHLKTALSLRNPLLNLVDFNATDRRVWDNTTQGYVSDPADWHAGELYRLPSTPGGYDGAVVVEGEDKESEVTKFYGRKSDEYLSWQALGTRCTAPLSFSQPWRSTLRPGDAAAIRIASGMEAKTLWHKCWVRDMDFSAYPPVVTVEIPGHRTKAGSATVAALGLESSYLGSEAAAPAGEQAQARPAGIPAPPCAPWRAPPPAPDALEVAQAAMEAARLARAAALPALPPPPAAEAGDPTTLAAAPAAGAGAGAAAAAQSAEAAAAAAGAAAAAAAPVALVEAEAAAALALARVHCQAPPLAAGVLPGLTSADCAPPAAANVSPLSGLRGEALAAAAAAQLEDLAASCQPIREAYSYAGSAYSPYARAPTPGVVGLRNLGNTCFMNSILQCLAASEPLTRYFGNPASFAELNIENQLGSGGKLALAWASLSRAMRAPTSAVLSPLLVKEFVTERAPQFAGFQQHDSKEFAEFLLAGLNEDMLRVGYPKQDFPDPVDGSLPDAAIAAESWRRHKARDDGIVTDIFAGMHHSKLQCTVCKTTSVKCDPWTSLLLSLPEFEEVELNSMPGGAESRPLTNVKLRRAKALSAPAPAAGGGRSGGGGSSSSSSSSSSGFSPSDEDDTMANDNNPNSLAFSARAPLPAKPGMTVAEAALWHGLAARDATLPPVLTDAMAAQAAADPVGALRGSGHVAARVHVKQLLFAGVADATARCDKEGAYKTLLYPLSAAAGASFIPANLRLHVLDTTPPAPAGSRLPSTVRMYEPALLHVTASTTCGDVLEQVWGHMQRFMAPEVVAAHSAARPPWRVLVLAPVRLEAAGAGAEGALEAAARERCDVLAHTADPFRWDWRTASLLVEATRESTALRLFPQYVNPAWGHQVAWAANFSHPAAKNSKAEVDLAALLDLNQQSELLEGMEEVYCSTCKSHRAFTKVMRLWRLPSIIPITLKRFKVQENAWGQSVLQKAEDPVSYPVVGLDLSPYLLGPRMQDVPALAFSPGRQPVVPQLPPIYDLFAVSNHGGGMGGGHYTAHIQDYATGQWHHMDGAPRSSAPQRPAARPRRPPANALHKHTALPFPPPSPPSFPTRRLLHHAVRPRGGSVRQRLRAVLPAAGHGERRSAGCQ